MPNATLILPYSVEDKIRKKPFTLDMEISAILCHAEARRKKPGILDGSSEKVSFISKLYYPIWFIPWKESCLLVDGLAIISHTFPYVKLPDVELFTEEIKRSVANKEQFRIALRKNAQTFGTPELTRISLNAIFDDENLLSIFSEYFQQVSALKERRSDRVALVPPKLNENAASEKAKEAVDLWERIRFDVKGLDYAIRVLTEETSFEEEMILREIEQLREIYEAKIVSLRPIVEKKIEKLYLERDAKIGKLDKSTDRKLAVRLREKRRHEREVERLERNIIEYKERRKRSKRRGNGISASKWEHRMGLYQNKLSETRGKLRSVLELIETIRKQRELDAQNVKTDYQLSIENEKRRILDIEASRELEIESRKHQIEEMKAEASTLIEQVRRLIELKKSEASRIEEAAIPHKVGEITLLCMPFYLVRYETKETTRYLMFPPAVAMDFKGIVRKLQKTIHRFSLQSRINLLLRSKSTSLEKMLRTVLLAEIRSDRSLEEAVYELGMSNNFLHHQNLEQILAKGIGELKNEGWISREEQEALLKTYL